jgi:hypothetical protein
MRFRGPWPRSLGRAVGPYRAVRVTTSRKADEIYTRLTSEFPPSRVGWVPAQVRRTRPAFRPRLLLDTGGPGPGVSAELERFASQSLGPGRSDALLAEGSAERGRTILAGASGMLQAFEPLFY